MGSVLCIVERSSLRSLTPTAILKNFAGAVSRHTTTKRTNEQKILVLQREIQSAIPMDLTESAIYDLIKRRWFRMPMTETLRAYCRNSFPRFGWKRSLIRQRHQIPSAILNFFGRWRDRCAPSPLKDKLRPVLFGMSRILFLILWMSRNKHFSMRFFCQKFPISFSHSFSQCPWQRENVIVSNGSFLFHRKCFVRFILSHIIISWFDFM